MRNRNVMMPARAMPSFMWGRTEYGPVPVAGRVLCPVPCAVDSSTPRSMCSFTGAPAAEVMDGIDMAASWQDLAPSVFSTNAAVVPSAIVPPVAHIALSRSANARVAKLGQPIVTAVAEGVTSSLATACLTRASSATSVSRSRFSLDAAAAAPL